MENEKYAFRPCPYCGADVADHATMSVPLGSAGAINTGCMLIQKDVIAIIKIREDQPSITPP